MTRMLPGRNEMGEVGSPNTLEQRIISRLRAAGLQVNSLDEFLRCDDTNSRVAAELLAMMCDPAFRLEAYRLGRSLIKWCTPSELQLLADALSSRPLHLQRHELELISFAIAKIASRRDLSIVVSLLRDRRIGLSRIGLLHVIKKFRKKEPGLLDVISELRQDVDLASEIGAWR